MADVIALFAAALIVVAGGFAAAVLARSVRRRKILAAKDRPRRLRRWLIAAITVFAVLVTALGAAGHYWAGVLHHTIPYLAPGGH